MFERVHVTSRCDVAVWSFKFFYRGGLFVWIKACLLGLRRLMQYFGLSYAYMGYLLASGAWHMQFIFKVDGNTMNL